MKKLRMISVLGLALIAGTLMITCDSTDHNDATGKIEFGIAVDGSEGLKSDIDSNNVRTHAAVVTLANSNGDLVLDHEVLQLYNFGGQWMTRAITLKTGIYKLLKFIIIDADGNVMYAAPVEGSPKAYLVKDPLPIRVEIIEEHVTRVKPEVLAVHDDPPEEFGYVSFGYTVVRIVDLFIAAYIDNPEIMAPMTFTEAELHIRIDSVWSYRFKLQAKINKIVLPKINERYMLTIIKEGYHPVEYIMSVKEIEETSEENPLLVPLKSISEHILILKPGPEKGIDATIFMSRPDENFGKHPYFEAAMSPPYVVYDHKEVSRSLIRFDMNDLPKSAIIQGVNLTLFYRTPFFYDSVPNELMTDFIAVFQRIIKPWEEDAVTWNTQPETTEKGQVFLSARPWISANFYTIDVTSLFVYEDPTSLMNYGMMFKMVETKGITGFSFASSDHPEEYLFPTLTVYYTLPD